ncbi:LysR family transcriptional regulator [Falsirhodobacter sp. 1013]|uniref:LysR family transcriptional regulator n=1 Tax=Falsirhodobacter sp. 1013 TaxID=3417566 RepID=UPI003EB77B64
MDVRDLAYLHAILRTGSVAAAAEQMGRTPPALTKAVRRLEEELNVTLFRRMGRGLEPTEAATFLADQTWGMVTRLEVVGRQVRDVGAGRRGHLKLGVAATMAAIFLPSFLRRLGAEHPDLRISVINGMNDVLHTALREGDIDLVLGVVDRTNPDMTDALVLAEDHVRIAAAAHHPLQGRPVALEEVLAQKWVLPARSVAMRQWFDAAFAARGLQPPSPHVETSSIAVLEELIGGTEYLSFISGLKMELPALADRISPLMIDEFSMVRQMGATWGSDPSPSTRVALSLLLEA